MDLSSFGSESKKKRDEERIFIKDFIDSDNAHRALRMSVSPCLGMNCKSCDLGMSLIE